MFGLYKWEGEDITLPTITETYESVLAFHADEKIDRDITVETFEDFLRASGILISNSSKNVRMILNDLSFRSIVNRGELNDSVKFFISQGGDIVIDVLKQSTQGMRKKMPYRNVGWLK